MRMHSDDLMAYAVAVCVTAIVVLLTVAWITGHL